MGLFIFSFFAVLLLGVVAAQQKTVTHEVDAINTIIKHWNLGSKVNLTGDPCNPDADWATKTANPQIRCDCSEENECHITHLKIYALDVYGEIPQELFLLTELIDLNLGQNVLNGPIPPEIGQLSKMQYLSLGINNFTGPVPKELGNLTNLISLSFGSNNLTGTLPRELGNLASLEQLYIDSSGVSGEIPIELSNWRAIQILWLSDNRLTGKIPDFFGSFTDLTVLRLEGTSLEGPIPTNFGALTKLVDLRIGDLNASSSTLDFLRKMTSLSTLSLRNCQFRGQIPETLGNFSNLQFLDLSFNKLTGRIPTSLKNLPSLKYLYLGSNNLNGDIPSDIMNGSLAALDVSFNNLTGNIALHKKGKSINVVGTSINYANMTTKAADMLFCLRGSTKCSFNFSTSFAVNSGGPRLSSQDNTVFDYDEETLGAASLYASPESRWAVSTAGVYLNNGQGSHYEAETGSQVIGTVDSELYKTARVAPSSLRYYGLGLKNGVYKVVLHFAEIQMDDSTAKSWKSLGRRVFDVYIQGESVLKDFDILNEAGGSKRAVFKEFRTNVTNTAMDIHLQWAGKGTCCIPFQSTFGPLISAVQVSLDNDDS